MSLETPPPHSPGQTDQWIQDLIDYLLRMNADKQAQIDALEVRIEALEP